MFNSHIPYCPKCFPENEEWMVYNFKKTRDIPLSHFDIFDTDYPIKKHYWESYERVCRICGSRLLQKNGTYNRQRRYCKKHIGNHYYEYNWNAVRYSFINKFIRKHRIYITMRMLDEIHYSKWNSQYLYCEKCHEILHISAIEVHHKIPVHVLTVNNYLLIWDLSNLQILCKKCHNNTDHLLKQTDEEKKLKKAQLLEYKYRKYKKIDTFFN